MQLRVWFQAWGSTETMVDKVSRCSTGSFSVNLDVIADSSIVFAEKNDSPGAGGTTVGS